MGESPRRYPFRHRQRLHGSRAFAAVFDAQMRKNLGVIALCGRCNGLDYNRLGLSVPRRVGGAVVRVRIKRRLREAFRLGQHDVPAGYDLVVVVRPHETLTVTEYQALLADGIVRLHELAQKRAGKQDSPA
ncbi:MAG: ribonuclease P protein component [Phycisphaerales bacterium]